MQAPKQISQIGSGYRYLYAYAKLLNKEGLNSVDQEEVDFECRLFDRQRSHLSFFGRRIITKNHASNAPCATEWYEQGF